MKPYTVVEKAVGETPLEAIKRWRRSQPNITDEPIAYAGRLDPMASGKLLLLIGDECKKQEEYHGLDKAYRFEVLFGTESDSGDVLGLVDWQKPVTVTEKSLKAAAKSLLGNLALPYPRFSSKTVAGKPLHLWTLENRLDEIEIPTAHTKLYGLRLLGLRTVSADAVYREVKEKIETISPITDESKALGADFRRKDVRLSWQVWHEHHKGKAVQIATLEAITSSGTYIRALAPELARRLGTNGLAYSIHRTEIGRYLKLPFGLGFWTKRF